jgi:hypothetical protein
MGILYRLDVVESKYVNQIAPPATVFESERPLKSTTTFIVKYVNICQCRIHQKGILWTQKQNRKRLHQKLGGVRRKTKIFHCTAPQGHTWSLRLS